jgi:hypothetical protein
MGYHIEKILSQVDVTVSFRMKSPKDTNLLAEIFGTPKLDFTRHRQPFDLHNGYGIWAIDEITEGITTGGQKVITHSNAVGDTETDTEGENEEVTASAGGSKTHADSNTVTEGDSEEEAFGVSKDVAESETKNDGWTNTVSDGFDDRHRFDNERFTGGASGGTAKGRTERVGKNKTTKRGTKHANAQGETDTRGENWANTIGNGKNRSKAIGKVNTRTDGESEGSSWSLSKTIAHRKIPLATPQRVYLDTGKLLVSIQDQIARVKQMLATLPVGQCLVLANGESFRFHVPMIPEIGCIEWKMQLVESFKKFIREKPHYFIPNLETAKWTGKKETDGSSRSAKSTPRLQGNGSKRESLETTAFLRDVQNGLGNGNGNGSSTKDQSS